MKNSVVMRTLFQRLGVPRDVDEAALLEGLTADYAELNRLDGVTPGTAAASKAAVLGANKNLDTLAIADGGLKLGAAAGTAVTAKAAELNVLAEAPCSATLTPAQGAANVCEVSIQLKKADGTNYAHPAFLDVWLSDSAVGENLTAHAADTLAVKAANGISVQATVANKMHRIQTTSAGLAVFQITDTHKTAFVVCAMHPTWGLHAAVTLAAGNFG